ncbi:nucleosome assembly protein [Tricladium varicosporioides]|nr:nucleosome assembly protein [Hymenoscyphus varicosporioides]
MTVILGLSESEKPRSPLLPHTAGFLKRAPETVAEQVRELLKLQDQQLELFKEYQERLHDLEREFHDRYTPLFDARSNIINPPCSQLNSTTTDQRLSNSITTIESDVGISNFWLRALKNNATLGDYITKGDEAALNYLRDIRLEYPSSIGFKIIFEFDPNPFLNNHVLTKTFLYERDPDDCTGELVLGEAQGEEIHWKDGRDLTSVIAIDGNRKHVYKEVVHKPSFFVFFETVTNLVDETDSEDDSDDSGNDGDDDTDSEDENDGTDGEEEGGDEDEDDSEVSQLKVHFSIGEELRGRIIPCAVHWYTGEARIYEESDWEEE